MKKYRFKTVVRICIFLMSISPVLGQGQTSHLIERLEVVSDGIEPSKQRGEKLVDIQLSGAEGLDAHLEAFIGQPITEENIDLIKKSIETFFYDKNRILVFACARQQKVEEGRVVLTVQPARIGNVVVKGNRWFKEQWILDKLNLKSQEELSEERMINQAAWLNRNPFIFTTLVLSPGKLDDTADVEVLAKDRFPARFYAGSDNSGTSPTGNNRFFVGTNFSAGMSNLFTYQFTSAFSFPEYLSHFWSWTSLLPWKHEFVCFGTYATTRPEITHFSTHGNNFQASIRYNVPIRPLYTPFLHQYSAGVDYKNLNNALFFLGGVPGSLTPASLNQKTADLFQFYLGYQLSQGWDKLKLTFNFENYFSPFIFLPNQTAIDYNSIRPKANIRYWYGKLALGTIYKLSHDFSISSLLRAQLSSGALLPSEQFGLGGYATVRGYQENIYLADNALIGNFEIHSPTLHPFWRIKNETSKLIFLSFLDAAYGHNWHPSSSYPTQAWLLGMGAGVRYNIEPYLTTRLDYGFRVHNTNFGNPQLGRVHFSVVLSY